MEWRSYEPEEGEWVNACNPLVRERYENLISSCLATDPSARPPLQTVVQILLLDSPEIKKQKTAVSLSRLPEKVAAPPYQLLWSELQSNEIVRRVCAFVRMDVILLVLPVHSIVSIVLEYYGYPPLKLEKLTPIPEQVVRHDIIGRGGNTVYRADYDGNPVAVRAYELRFQDSFEHIQWEYEWCYLSHRNVLLTHGFIMEPPENTCMVMERGKLNLATIVEEPKLVTHADWQHTPQRKIQWCLDIANGLRYLHAYYLQPLLHSIHGCFFELYLVDAQFSAFQHDLCHLIAEYAEDAGSKLVVCHGGLRLTKLFSRDDDSIFIAALGEGQKSASNVEGCQTMGKNSAFRWFSPEMFDDEMKRTSASDIYSFGLVMFSIWTRSIPFQNRRNHEIGPMLGDRQIVNMWDVLIKDYQNAAVPAWIENHKIANWERPDEFPSRFKRLLQRCLIRDYWQRPHINEIYKELIKLSQKIARTN